MGLEFLARGCSPMRRFIATQRHVETLNFPELPSLGRRPESRTLAAGLATISRGCVRDMIKHADFEPPISFARLREMIEALDSGGDLDSVLREDIRYAIFLLYAIQNSEKMARRKGRPPSRMRTIYIWLHELVSKHGVTQKSALSELAPDASESERQTIAREYRALVKKGEFPSLGAFTTDTLADLAETLPKSKRGK